MNGDEAEKENGEKRTQKAAAVGGMDGCTTPDGHTTPDGYTTPMDVLTNGASKKSISADGDVSCIFKSILTSNASATGPVGADFASEISHMKENREDGFVDLTDP